MTDMAEMVYIENNHLTNEALAICAEALNRGASDSLPPAVQEHIASCTSCKKEIFAISETIVNISVQTKSESSPRRYVKTTRLLYLAGTAAAALIVGGLWYLTKNTPRVNPVTITQALVQKDSTNTGNKGNTVKREPKKNHERYSLAEKQLANNNAEMQGEAFRESGFFENLVQSAYRGSNMLEVEPANNEVFKRSQPINFTFKTEMPEPLSLILFNNEGRKIFSAAGIRQESYSLDTTLQSGLYYWKLENSTDLLYTGKFFIQSY
jgi:hypothetical protein